MRKISIVDRICISLAVAILINLSLTQGNNMFLGYNFVVHAAETNNMLDYPKNFRATKVTETSIILSWSSVRNADAYRVFFYNSETGEYEKYKDVKSTNCKVINLTANTTYSFKIAALVKNNNKYDEQTISGQLIVKTQSVKKLDAPKNIKKNVKGNIITLTWNPVVGADGYRIYVYNESTRNFEPYKSVTSSSCVISDLEYKTEYKIKISTLTKDGTKYYEQSSTGALRIETDYETINVEPKEWNAPQYGEYRSNVLLNCGIGNYTERTNKNGEYYYEGEAIFSGKKATITISFNSQDKIERYVVRIPNSTSDFYNIVDTAKKTMAMTMT